MNKGSIVLGVAVALLGSGLLWAAGSKGDSGIAGWEIMNASMEQAIGVAESDEASTTEGNVGGRQTKVDKQSAGKVTVGAEAIGKTDASDKPDVAEKVKVDTQVDHAVPTPVDEQGTTVAGENAAGALEVSTPAASQEGKINVNTAGAKELMDLPGIGEKKAQAIIDYRNREGAFRSLSDLGKVKGIGPKMLEKLKPIVVF
ncbi:helix-hairpin-helix domain-containing protein [Paenibacillus sp. G2S3]|uniref:ComEA family DNA-binding protein n=1 Tax=Paenibacillus sp. G2S3 TaxID=3047872 RepID=UPI0024C209DA|nr:helix-hairpin-helix domain-containing protein [Paenibacillus sp. G2S3]WHY18326.1 helix-hairpin-helix domain-containing protein [Paenibacillus sp. G2S3]